MSEEITLKDIGLLIDQFRQHSISGQEFCISFERIWNFQVDKKKIPAEVFESLDFLFDEVALFCPLPRKQWTYPKYRDLEEVHVAAAKALQSIVNAA